MILRDQIFLKELPHPQAPFAKVYSDKFQKLISNPVDLLFSLFKCVSYLKLKYKFALTEFHEKSSLNNSR